MKSLQSLSPFSSLERNELYQQSLIYSDNQNERQLFDSSFLNVLKVTGTDRLSYMQGQSTNQLKPLIVNDGITTLVGNTKAKLIARVELFIAEDCIYLLHEAATTDALMAQLDMFIIAEDVQMELLSNIYSVTYTSSSKWTSSFDGDYGFIQNNDGLIFKWTGFGNNTITHCFSEQNIPDVSTYSFLDAQQLEMVRITNFYPIASQEYNQNDKLIAELEHNNFVSFSKGCFLGYEILARIRNRGHTNKTLSLIEFEKELLNDPIGEKLFIDETSKGLVTSHVINEKKSYVLGYLPTLLKEVGKSVKLHDITGTIIR